jgi:hypothetical protein
VTDLATMTTILYAARLQRRVPESEAEKRGTIVACLADAIRIEAIVSDYEAEPEYVAEPKQPPPSPGNNTGVLAEVKATRRRG